MKRLRSDISNLYEPRVDSGHNKRAAFTRVEAVIGVSLLVLLLSIGIPAVAHLRESARKQVCRSNLRLLDQAMLSYYSTFSSLPPAAIWNPRSYDDLAEMHRSDDPTALTFQNWLQLLLPHVDKMSVFNSIDPSRPIGSPANELARTCELNLAKCPSDHFNSWQNVYKIHSQQFGDLKFSRGNYAINGGTHRVASVPGTPADPVPEGFSYLVDEINRKVEYSGNGIAGFNKSFSLADFKNGVGTTVAIDEVRAGIHAVDSRGVWALGQIGSSVTWAHGMNGDAGRPNDRWKRSDDIRGCKELHKLFGEKGLVSRGMPCCNYIQASHQAVARSCHANGVHVAMMDGSVRFVSDEIAPGLWHAMHSRSAPAEIFGDEFVLELEKNAAKSLGGQPSASASDDLKTSMQPFMNSIGMSFSLLPAGRFMMGLPDEWIDTVFENDGVAKPHWVKISKPFNIGVHEVTESQFEAVMNPAASSSTDRSSSAQVSADGKSRLPASRVTWFEAKDFCERLSQHPAELAANRRYRLPTEAEWEFACRCGQTEPHLYIAKRQPSDQTGENAMKEPPLPICEVGSYPTNEFGLHDMRGNVWEWTADWSELEYYARSPEKDPTGPTHGYLKVVRGSDWLYVGQKCTLGFRATAPWLRSPFIGFRVVCEISAKSR